MTTSSDRPPAPMARWFPPGMPAGRLARRTALVTLVGLVPPLALYVALTPGLWASLAGDPTALWYFLRQVLLNGLPTVFAVNWVGFSLHVARAERPRSALGALVLDIAARVALFFLVTAASYVAFALAFGSFAGDPATALGVVGPTLAEAATFGNLSGVYLYATAVSALPLFLAAGEDLLARLPRLARALGAAFVFLPGRARPVASALAVSAVMFALFAALVSGLAAQL
jgi:hypothetical protein